jgi:hypothetical protein
VPFDSEAVATNCELLPTDGPEPLTATDETVGVVVGVGVVGDDDVDLEPHAHTAPAIPRAVPVAVNHRTI